MNRMQTLLILLSISTLLGMKADDNIGLFNSWKLVCHSNLETKIDDCKPFTENPLIEITFLENGEFKGHTINRFEGEFKVANNQVELLKLKMTEINETDIWCKNFFNDLKTMNKIKIVNDTLILFDPNNFDALKFVVVK